MTGRSKPVVAIDGPAGAGKSTVTKRVAQALAYLLLDTGAIYRSVALGARQRDIAWSDDERLAALALEFAKHRSIEFLRSESGAQTVWLEGIDVTLAIRTQEMSDGASRVSSVPAVRAALLELQRMVGRDGGVVVEGRDIGSVVFPDAEAKFYLTASVEVRAQRRLDELLGRGEVTDLETVAQAVRERDERDRNRSVAPLIQAPDALLVDSSYMTIEHVVALMVDRVRLVAQSLQSPR